MNGSLPLLSVKARIIGGFAFLCFIFAVAGGISAWQERIHRADLNDLDRHAGTATRLQEAEAQAGIAALLLQRYVIVGDDTYIPEIRQHAGAAVNSLTAAVSRSAPPGIDEIAVQGVGLAQGAGRITALRQSGDVDGAAAAMEEIVPIFREFRLGLEDASAQELAQVAALRASADQAGDLAFLLLIVSGVIGISLALGASALIARSIIKPLSSLEATAAAASRGDLSARAPATGPRELAHLGSVLNEMMETVEARTLQLSQANEELMERNRQLTDARSQAATDPLTGLGNHRAFHKRIRDDVVSTDTDDPVVSLILFDIDGFKAVNDSLGHLAGDEMLRRLAATVVNVVPPADAYRYGGDEFAVVLPRLDRRQATQIAEQLRGAVESATAGQGERLTVSLGVCSFPEMAQSAEELIYRADMAMYWAKSSGKNRVGDWEGLLRRRRAGTIPDYPGDRRGKVHDGVASLVAALAAKDPVTRDHIERCSWYAAELASYLGLDEHQASVLRLASLLHDIGKLVVPDEVLRKPGPLDHQEWDIIRQHPTSARHILSRMDSVADAIPAILHHHERFDGSGYPDGLAGQEIPLTSRILMVSDAFDAMTTDRPYRRSMSIEEALAELRRNSGTQFDPEVVQAFVEMISRHGAHPLHQAAQDAATQPLSSDPVADK